MKFLNDIVKDIKETANLRMFYRKLEKHSLKIYVFVDIRYNVDQADISKLGMVIVLVDDEYNWLFLHCASSKCQRTTRSRFPSETYAFQTDAGME